MELLKRLLLFFLTLGVTASMPVMKIGNQNVDLLVDTNLNESFVTYNPHLDVNYNYTQSNTSVVLANFSSGNYYNTYVSGEKICDYLTIGGNKTKFEFLNVKDNLLFNWEDNYTGVIGLNSSSDYWTSASMIPLCFSPNNKRNPDHMDTCTSLSTDSLDIDDNWYVLENILPGWNLNLLTFGFEYNVFYEIKKASFNTRYMYISIPNHVFSVLENQFASEHCKYNNNTRTFACSNTFSIPETIYFEFKIDNDPSVVVELDRNTFIKHTNGKYEVLLNKNLEEKWILGIPFIKQFSWILDKKHNSIKLMKAKDSVQISENIPLVILFSISLVTLCFGCCLLFFYWVMRPKRPKKDNQYAMFPKNIQNKQMVYSIGQPISVQMI